MTLASVLVAALLCGCGEDSISEDDVHDALAELPYEITYKDDSYDGEFVRGVASDGTVSVRFAVYDAENRRELVDQGLISKKGWNITGLNDRTLVALQSVGPRPARSVGNDIFFAICHSLSGQASCV